MMKRRLARAITLVFTADWTLGSIDSIRAGTIKDKEWFSRCSATCCNY